jgi:hypothetical protein
MDRKTRWIATGIAALGVVASGTGVAAAQVDDSGTDDDREEQLSGEELDRASTAAVEEAGGGEVVDAEAEDEGETGYEVEVRLDDGSEVDVQLDDSFAVVSAVNEGPDDDANEADDDANEADDDADDRDEADDADDVPADQRQTTTTEARPGS